MKIKILGTRAKVEETAPYHSKHSGVLVDDQILFDLGEREYLDYNPKCIFITHLHPDHAFFVTQEIVEDSDIPIYAPETSDRLRSIQKMPKTVKLDSYSITSIPTHHSLKVESMAYLIEKESHRVLYTGDLIWINKEYHKELQGLDLVLTDGSFIRDKGLIRRDQETGQLYGHNGIPNLIKLFTGLTEHIVFIHFGTWFYKDIQKSRKKIEELGNNLKVEAAYDGRTLNL
ncbi:MAG: MBL fold metallo-hydrolase [Thermoproteota archaeon]